MAEQVNVHIKNVSVDEVEFKACLEHSDGTREPFIPIPRNEEKTIFLPEPDLKLIITPKSAVDFGTCWYNVTNNEHLVLWEPMSDHWRVQMAANDTDPEVPLDVNAEVGGDEP